MTQRACVKWFRLQYPQLSKNLISIPNGYQTSAIQARIAIAEGLTAGAADLVLFYPSHGFHALFIEMKTPKGRQSPKQKEFQAHVERFGYQYIICRSLDEFRAKITEYFS